MKTKDKIIINDLTLKIQIERIQWQVKHEMVERLVKKSKRRNEILLKETK